MTKESIERLLPENLVYLCSIIGTDNVINLVEARGGTRINIPRHPLEKHWLADHIGFEALKKLCDVFGGDYFEVAKCSKLLAYKKAQSIVNDHNNGMSNSELAIKYDCTERGIRKARRRIVELVPRLHQ